jgi:hypothetical protein
MMLHNTKNLGQLLTAREMKGIKGGAGGRKYVCVICSYMNVHCATVPSSWNCEVLDYDPDVTGSRGWLGCQSDNQENFELVDNCTI